MILEFIKENYQFVSLCFAAVLDVILFIVCCFVKHKKVNPVLEGLLKALPSCICLVEKSIGSGNGEKKKELVLKTMLDFYKHYTGVQLSLDSEIAKYIDEAIEDILSAPQKKGN